MNENNPRNKQEINNEQKHEAIEIQEKKFEKRKQKEKKTVVIDKINERKTERNLRIYAKHERKTKELNK